MQKVSFVCDQAVVDELDRLADTLSMTRSSVINELLKIVLLERPCPDPVEKLLGGLPIIPEAHRQWLKAYELGRRRSKSGSPTPGSP